MEIIFTKKVFVLFTKVIYCKIDKHMHDQFRLFTVYIETTNETKREQNRLSLTYLDLYLSHMHLFQIMFT